MYIMNTEPHILNTFSNFDIVGPGRRHYAQAAFGLSRFYLINVIVRIIFPIYFINIHFSKKINSIVPHYIYMVGIT